MKKIILHVGPGKCGSSSIQAFFKNKKNPFFKELQFNQIPPQLISKLNHVNPTEDSIKNFSQLINNAFKSTNTLILSHEYLFDCPDTIKNMCAIAHSTVSKIIIIGYSRPQADFIISTYSQWFFRAKQRIKEAEEIIKNQGIDPTQFNGLERHLIASIIDDFYSARQLSNMSILDWHQSYNNLEEITAPFQAQVRPGIIPSKNTAVNLIEDFCLKAGLHLKSRYKHTTQGISNVSFNKDLIEALNTATQQNLKVPTPHEDNSYLAHISKTMNTGTENNQAFIQELKKYINAYFSHSNTLFCNTFQCVNTFVTSEKEYTKDAILTYIESEERKRIAENYMLKYYKSLAAVLAETCFTLQKK